MRVPCPLRFWNANMLSAGEYHKRVPKDPYENLKYRQWVAQRTKNDPKAQALFREICRRDILFWINVFVWQYNPLKRGSEIGTFVSWDFQDDAILKMLWCIRHDRSAIIEKSREMGGTYLLILVFLWCCLFHPYKKFLFISRSAEAVDQPGDPDCIFWKLEHILENTPKWLSGPVTRRKMFFGFASTRSSITGQASTGKAGVGGRATAVGLDEFSQVKEDKEVRQRMASTTNCRIFNGTHLGPGTEFYDLCQQPEIIKIQMHWTQHPDKRKGLYRSGAPGIGFEVLDKQYPFPEDFTFVTDGKPAGGPHPGLRSPWYDNKSRDIGDARGVACDLDIDAKGSVSQIVDPLQIRDLQHRFCTQPYWEGDLDYDKQSGEPVRLVQAKGGMVKLWMYPNAEGKIPADRFVFSADISTGQGATNSCLSGAKADKGEKVLEIATPFMKEEAFAVLAVALARLFANEDGDGAQLCWERQGAGDVFGRKVVSLNYNRLWYHIDSLKVSKEMSKSPGWWPTVENKYALIKEYFLALYSYQYLNRSFMALEECLDWKYDAQGHVVHGGQITCKDPSGAGVNHGDRSVADAINWMLCKPHYFSAKKPENQEVKPHTLAWRQQLRQDARRKEHCWS